MRVMRSAKMNARLTVSSSSGEPNSLKSGPISPYLKSTVFQMRKKNQKTIEKCSTSCKLEKRSVSACERLAAGEAQAYMVSASEANC